MLYKCKVYTMVIFTEDKVFSSLSEALSFCVKTPGISFSRSGCGGVLTASEGSFTSPNHPGSYPPNSLCVWVIHVSPPSSVQIHVSSLTVEGPSPCLFDWLEVQEQIEQSSVVTRLVRWHPWIRHPLSAFPVITQLELCTLWFGCTWLSPKRKVSKCKCSVIIPFYPSRITIKEEVKCSENVHSGIWNWTEFCLGIKLSCASMIKTP